MQDSAQQAAAAQLLLKLLEDVLCEDAYLADMASLSYQVSSHAAVVLLARCCLLLPTNSGMSCPYPAVCLTWLSPLAICCPLVLPVHGGKHRSLGHA